MKKVGFSIYSFKICTHIYAINIDSYASYWVYFVRELEKSLVQGFRDSLTQQTNLLSYNLKQEFKKVIQKQRQNQQVKRLKLLFENLPLIERRIFKR